jgi:PTS system ascorbate-specific IIC component
MIIIDFIINKLLRELSIFLGLITLAGSIFLKKSPRDSITSTIKTIVGVRILQIGTNTLVESSKPMVDMLITRTGLQGRVADVWVGVGEVLQRLNPALAGQVGMIMIFAWISHLLIARISKFKVIYLTMQLAYVDTVWVLWGVTVVTGWVNTPAVLLTIFLLSFYWTILPALIRRYLKPVVGEEEITLGHNSMAGGLLAVFLAGLTGKSRSAEDLSLPGWLAMFKDNVVSYGVFMVAIYMLIGVIAGPQVGAQFSNGSHYLVFSLIQGATVAAGLFVLITGVKLFLAELLPAFKGFAEKIVPGAVPAVDAPIFITYRPQSALLGFASTLVGMAVGILIQVGVGIGQITIPSIIPIFFSGSLFGVMADAHSGWRGVLFSCFILGIVFIIGTSLYAQLTDMRIAAAGNMDYVLIWLPLFTAYRIFIRG